MKKVNRKSVFTKNVNNHGMNRETVYQIVRIISQISLKLHIKFFIVYGLMQLRWQFI